MSVSFVLPVRRNSRLERNWEIGFTAPHPKKGDKHTEFVELIVHGRGPSMTKHDVSQTRNNPRLSVFNAPDTFGPE